MKSKICMIILFVFTFNTIKSQNNIDVVFNETQINKALRMVTSARAFNIGDYKNKYGLNYWYLNLDNASIDIHPNNRIIINSITFSGGVDIDIWLLNLTPTGAITGYLDGKFYVTGNNESGYILHITFDRHPVLEYNGSFEGVINMLMQITDNFGLILPDIEINMGSSLLPDLLSKYVKSGIPAITTNNEEVILSFEILFDDLCLQNRTIKAGETAIYSASNSIILKEGFAVSNGANFSAKIEPKNSLFSSQRNDDKQHDEDGIHYGDSIVSPIKLECLLSDNEIDSLLYNSSDNLTNIQNENIENPLLEQNIPNPFTDETMLNCYIPENAISSYIQISGILGNILKKIPLPQTGENQVLVRGTELGKGIYTYSLVVDGKLIGTKRMIVK